MSSLRSVALAVLLVLPGLCFAQSQGTGVTADGKKGQIYKVQKGDTLWAISQTYLGTPWIWPSVWKENEAEIANPHRIFPGELIWISEGMMRKLTPEEAARLAPQPGRARRPPRPRPRRPRRRARSRRPPRRAIRSRRSTPRRSPSDVQARGPDTPGCQLRHGRGPEGQRRRDGQSRRELLDRSRDSARS